MIDCIVLQEEPYRFKEGKERLKVCYMEANVGQPKQWNSQLIRDISEG